MKKTLLSAILCIGFTVVNAQDKDWSIEIGYPISVGDEFGASNQGVISAGLKYRFATAGKLRIGASLDATWFSTTSTNDSDPIQEFKMKNFFIQPRIFGELPITKNDKLNLLGGLGWTWNRSVERLAFFDDQGEVQGDDWNNGFNLNLGLSYNLSTRWFVQAQYDLIFLSGDSPSRNVGLIKVGAGFRF